jgi:predicted MFS family arabinose efflux permease
MEGESSRHRGRSAWDRLSLPDISGQRSLAASLVVDSLGDGLFVPFAIVYFLHTTHLSLTAIGLGLSVAGFVAIGSVVPAGVLLDRFRAAKLVIAANLLSGIAFAGYLVVGQFWQLILFALLAATGSRVYWTANLALIGDAFNAGDRPRWFAFQRALRNAGFGLGGLVGAIAISGGDIGYQALAAINAVSYLAAATLVYLWSRHNPSASHQAMAVTTRSDVVASPRRQQDSTPGLGTRKRREHEAAGQPAGAAGFAAPLRDRSFLLIVATNLLFVLCGMVLPVLVAVYLTRALHLPVWLSGVLFALNAAVVALGQTTTSRAVGRLRPARMLQLASLAWTISFLVFWAAALLPRNMMIPALMLAILIFTAAEMIQGPALNDLVVAIAPDSARGRYLGVYQLSWGAGAAVAPALFSWLFTISAGLPWPALAVACGLWTVVMTWLDPRTSNRPS